jgi:hypothetical protein
MHLVEEIEDHMPPKQGGNNILEAKLSNVSS